MFIRPNSRSPAPPSPNPSQALVHTPSLKYQPLTKADRKTDEHLQEMVRYRERKGQPHPDLPTKPAGAREMTGEEAAATRLFRDRYLRTELEANMNGTRGDFDRHEYCQTYRREGDEIVANRDGFIVGGFNYVAPQSGRFPPGTRVDIHSHPNMAHPANAMPSDLDQRVAHQLRTNALHRPGTMMSGAIMYYPPTGKFFGYSGELTGFRKRPEYHELIDTLPETHTTSDYARARLRVPDAPPRRYIPYHPDYHRPEESLAASSPAPVPATRPIPIPGASTRAFPRGGPSSGSAPDQGLPDWPLAPSSLSPRMLPADNGGFKAYTPPDPSAWSRRAVSADSRIPAADLPVVPAATGIVHQPKPRRAADIKAMPPLPQWEALTGPLEDLSLDDHRGRSGFGEPSGSIIRRNRVVQRSQDGSRGPRPASIAGNPPLSPSSLPKDIDAPASLRPDGARPLPNPWNDPGRS